jgi:hypothetical protein
MCLAAVFLRFLVGARLQLTSAKIEKKDDFLAIDVSVKADSSLTKASNRTQEGAKER